MAVDAVPHGFDPLAAEDPEDDHERMQEVCEVPAWNDAAVELLRNVVASEHLHPHHGEDEDDDGEDEAEVAEGADGPADDADKEVQRRPRLGQLEHAHLKQDSEQTANLHAMLMLI